MALCQYSNTNTATAEKKSRLILSEEESDIHMFDMSIVIPVFSMRILISLLADEILLPRYVKCHLKWKWFFFVYMRLCRHQCLLLLAPGCAAEIRFGLVYLWETLDHLRNQDLKTCGSIFSKTILIFRKKFFNFRSDMMGKQGKKQWLGRLGLQNTPTASLQRVKTPQWVPWIWH